ncbi:hypothetical protein ACN47E_005175 [Coniothyrium glycines]
MQTQDAGQPLTASDTETTTNRDAVLPVLDIQAADQQEYESSPLDPSSCPKTKGKESGTVLVQGNGNQKELNDNSDADATTRINQEVPARPMLGHADDTARPHEETDSLLIVTSAQPYDPVANANKVETNGEVAPRVLAMTQADSIKSNSDIDSNTTEDVILVKEKPVMEMTAGSDVSSVTASDPDPKEHHQEDRSRLEVTNSVQVATSLETSRTLGATKEKIATPIHRNLPPHTRTNFTPPVLHGQEFPVSQNGLRTAGFYHGENSRSGWRPQTYRPTSYRNDGDGEQVVRLGAQLMKARDELVAARLENANQRETMEAEQRQKIETAFSSMLADLLRKQVEALNLKAKVEAKERDLEYREKCIGQLEVFLSEGQKQLNRQLDVDGFQSMNACDHEHKMHQAELRAEKSIQDANSKVEVEFEQLRLHQAALKLREQQYKASIYSQIESEFHSKQITPEKIEEVADLEYSRGFRFGKEAGHKAGLLEAGQVQYLRGYASCHRALSSLANLRAGRIAHDSPELAFLFDAGHPENPFLVGKKAAQLDMGQNQAREGIRKEAMAPTDPKPSAEVKKKDIEITAPHSRPVNDRRFPPPRPTFASEFRGAQTMHNGHIVLANTSPPLAQAESRKTNGITPATVPPSAGREDEGAYTGRHIIKYDGSGDDNVEEHKKEQANLIDLH